VRGKEQDAQRASARKRRSDAASRRASRSMVEARGIEPLSKATQLKRLRAYPSEFMPCPPRRLNRQWARLGIGWCIYRPLDRTQRSVLATIQIKTRPNDASGNDSFGRQRPLGHAGSLTRRLQLRSYCCYWQLTLVCMLFYEVTHNLGTQFRPTATLSKPWRPHFHLRDVKVRRAALPLGYAQRRGASSGERGSAGDELAMSGAAHGTRVGIGHQRRLLCSSRY